MKLAPLHATTRLYKDNGNRRWLGYLRGKSRSRSFDLYGETGAMAQVLAFLWEVSGERCPHAWIVDMAVRTYKCWFETPCGCAQRQVLPEGIARHVRSYVGL